MEARNLTVTTEDLRLGMFVAELDLPWLGMPFPLEGVLIDHPRQVEALRNRCHEVVIDIDRSHPESIRHLPILSLDRFDARSRDGRGSITRRMRTWWESLVAAMFSRRRAMSEPSRRLADIPADVELVVHRDTASFDQAIGSARAVYRDIEVTMRKVMDGLAAKREISVEAIAGAAAELVESLAVNHEAMMWLVRMRQRNVRTYMHSVEVAVYMVTLGRHLGFPREHLLKFCAIGLLLDVGMTRIDNALLERAGSLSDTELAEIRKHVEYGLEILAKSPGVDQDVLEAIAQHHERIDGSGYPRGLRGHEMSFAGRMAAIADSFAALTAQRPHAEPLSAFNAMKVLFSCADRLYPEPLVEQFVQAIGLFPVGSLVELSTGEVAAVVSHNNVRRLKPRVLILTNVEKEPLVTPCGINLMLEPKDADGKPVHILRGLPIGAYGVNTRDYFLA